MAAAADHKISVFTGPVFGAGDYELRPDEARRPVAHSCTIWKVIVYKKSDGTKSATGFLLDQSDEIADLMEGFTPLPRARETRIHQRAVEEMEGLTSLDFGPLRNFDPLHQLETTKRSVRIRLPDQIVL